jgi:hypothetical protein
MEGISPSYNFKIISLHRIPTIFDIPSKTEIAVEGRSRTLNQAAWIMGPVVGLYRMSTGLIDVICGIFTLHSDLFFQGAKNLGRGTIESLVVLIPLVIALKSSHAITPLTAREVQNVLLELTVKVCALFVKHYSLMIPTYFALNAICQLPLYLYDGLLLKYYADMIQRCGDRLSPAKLYHDRNLQKTFDPPLGAVYDNLDEWIYRCETFGNKFGR